MKTGAQIRREASDALIIAAMFPNASKTTRSLNPIVAVSHPTPPATRTMAAPALNKTEQRWQDAHPSHVPFPLRLRWGNSMHYKPDFMERQPSENGPDVTLIEVKGAHIFDRDIVRFKGCAAEWGWLFTFQMWQWKDRKWTQIY